MVHEVSVEQLYHFRCESCSGWWSIADAPDKEFWYCPWCGFFGRQDEHEEKEEEVEQ